MHQLALLVLPCLCLSAPQNLGFGDATPDEISQIQSGSYQEDFDDVPQYTFNYKVSDEQEQTYIAMDEERAGDTVTGTYSYVDPLGSLIVVHYSAGPMGYTQTREVQNNFVDIKARPVRTQTVNVVATQEAQRLQAQRLEAQRLEAQRLEAQRLETQRFQTQRLEAQRLEAERLAFAEAQASAEAEASRLNAQRLETQRLEAQRLETQRLEAQRAEAASSAANSQANLVSQIVAQIQPLVSQTVSSAVAGQRQTEGVTTSGNIVFPSRTIRPVPVPRVRVPVAARVRVPASTRVRVPAPRLIVPARPTPTLIVPTVQQGGGIASGSDVTSLFGQGGTYNVRINTPDFNVEY